MSPAEDKANIKTMSQGALIALNADIVNYSRLLADDASSPVSLLDEPRLN